MRDLFTGQDLVVIRTTDNASIPVDNQNTDYQAYLAWLAEGSTPEPAEETTKE